MDPFAITAFEYCCAHYSGSRGTFSSLYTQLVNSFFVGRKLHSLQYALTRLAKMYPDSCIQWCNQKGNMFHIRWQSAKGKQYWTHIFGLIYIYIVHNRHKCSKNGQDCLIKLTNLRNFLKIYIYFLFFSC